MAVRCLRNPEVSFFASVLAECRYAGACLGAAFQHKRRAGAWDICWYVSDGCWPVGCYLARATISYSAQSSWASNGCLTGCTSRTPMAPLAFSVERELYRQIRWPLLDESSCQDQPAQGLQWQRYRRSAQ